MPRLSTDPPVSTEVLRRYHNDAAFHALVHILATLKESEVRDAMQLATELRRRLPHAPD